MRYLVSGLVLLPAAALQVTLASRLELFGAFPNFVLLAVVGFIFGPLIRLALSRRRESLADVSGVELTRNPAGLLSALKKLESNDKPFKGMNHSTAVRSSVRIMPPLPMERIFF